MIKISILDPPTYPSVQRWDIDRSDSRRSHTCSRAHTRTDRRRLWYTARAVWSPRPPSVPQLQIRHRFYTCSNKNEIIDVTFFFERAQFRFFAIKVEIFWVKMWFQFIDAMYNWLETLSLDDVKYYVWGNSVWHTRRFDTATGRTPVGPTLISCSTSRVTLDVLGTG